MPTPTSSVPEELSPSLAMALIASSTAPLLLLDGEMSVIAASASFCTAFGIGPDAVKGRELFVLGEGEWNVPQLRSLLMATASGGVHVPLYEMDLKITGVRTRCLAINVSKLSFEGQGEVRLLMAITDVTDARQHEKLKDDLLRERAVLLQELQHRVANSLQIIASVLLQSARTVSSEESRAHLTHAHSRVMSVAAVQQQLAASAAENVALKPYLTQLCQSLGASMIHDPDQVSLSVAVDDSVVDPKVSVSLGLVVTELVINALKHAFPDHRKGRITVRYGAYDGGWTLSVSDNGVGMPTGDQRPAPGLGTSIVQALARQLGAVIHIVDASPGVAVSIVHTELEPSDRPRAAEPAR